MTKKQVPLLGPVAAAPVQRQRICFTKEFKLKALAQMREGVLSPTQLALELGIRRNQLYKWAEALSADPVPPEAQSAANQAKEIARLQRELARAQEENRILKKFDAYLTQLKK